MPYIQLFISHISSFQIFISNISQSPYIVLCVCFFKAHTYTCAMSYLEGDIVFPMQPLCSGPCTSSPCCMMPSLKNDDILMSEDYFFISMGQIHIRLQHQPNIFHTIPMYLNQQIHTQSLHSDLALPCQDQVAGASLNLDYLIHKRW